MACARMVWLCGSERVARSPPSPSESKFAPTAKMMMSASEAISTAFKMISARCSRHGNENGKHLLD
jgi:hypothetical protein